MSKTLVIAEKPSVGRDLARVLPGAFQKHEGYLEGDDHVVTWAIGHLVQLAEPDAYDKKFKSWKIETLPIVPDEFKLQVRDERSRKQMTVIKRMMGRDDVDAAINACDAGREGELIFAYTYEQAKCKLPVERLWLSSMTDEAIRNALESLRPGAEMANLEAAARSRSEADWIVGMNATRAATVRLRSAFDGAVSLGRVQTPTLAIVVKREEEIRAFVPETYWQVDAKFEAVDGDSGRAWWGRYHQPEAKGKEKDRLTKAEDAKSVVEAVKGKTGEITKLEQKEVSEQAPLLYDLTTLQREANNRFGFSASRTLSSAQRLYDEHKLLTYPRTNSRYLPGDMAAEIKPTADHVGTHSEYAAAAKYVTGLDLLPTARVINDAKVTDHHAIIPTNAPQDTSKVRDDDLKVYDMVVRRFLAVFHPEAVFNRTTLETTVAEHLFRSRGRTLITAGWRAVYGEKAGDIKGADQAEKSEGRPDPGGNQRLPELTHGESAETKEVESLEKETKPPGRYSDASLLAAMETAGKLVDDEELREAMKDSGIGTPATRANIIENLIGKGYVEREGRSLVPTEKAMNVIRLLDEHPLTSPGLTGEWEMRLAKIEQGDVDRSVFMDDIAKFAGETVHMLDERLKGVKIPRANLGPCPVCGRDIIENRKGYSCWSKEDPGCGFVVWKSKAGKTLTPTIVKELIETRKTEKQVTGFKGRSGRSFRAKLKLEQNEEGKWRVEFDEPWATGEVKKPPDEETEEARAESESSDTAPPAKVSEAA